MPHKFKSHLFSLRHKILFVVALSTLLTATSITSLYYYKTTEQTIENELSSISTETSLLAPLLLSEFHDLREDIQALHETVGFLENSSHDAITPPQKKQLQTIFKSVIAQKKNYIQVRYIGLADDGREIVRVDRDGDDITIIPDEKLQKKSQETYFQDALTLPKGNIYFSAINLNREHGKVQVHYLPVIRVISPIYDRADKMQGMLVINASYENILTNFISQLKLNRDMYVINENGDYLLFKQASQTWDFYINEIDNKAKTLPLVQQILSSKKHSDTLNVAIDNLKNIAHYQKIFYAPNNEGRFLALVLSTPEQVILASAQQIKQDAVNLGFMMVIISYLLSVMLSFIITNPLGKIVEGIRNYTAGSRNMSLPTNAQDEIGELARSFQQLVRTLNASRQAEKDLLVRMQAIMDNTVDGLITIDEKGTIESFNTACTRIFGYTSNEVLGKNVKILMPEPYRGEHDTYLNNYKKTGEKKIMGTGREVLGLKKDGSTFPLDLSVSEVYVHGRKIYSGIVRDITERKQAEDALVEANAELEEFAYRTSHDLKSPLVSSIALLDVTETSIKSNNIDNALHSITLIQESLKKLQKLVEDILALTRTKKEIVAPQAVDVLELINTTLEQLSYMDNFKRINVEKNFDFNGTLITQTARFRHIIQNLISNAIKYQDLEKNKSFLMISTSEEDSKFILKIEDNGIGIPPDKREDMFEMFQRFHPRISFGSGLGLYMVKKSADLLKGEISYLDTGDGSLFTLTLPLEITGD